MLQCNEYQSSIYGVYCFCYCCCCCCYFQCEFSYEFERCLKQIKCFYIIYRSRYSSNELYFKHIYTSKITEDNLLYCILWRWKISRKIFLLFFILRFLLLVCSFFCRLCIQFPTRPNACHRTLCVMIDSSTQWGRAFSSVPEAKSSLKLKSVPSL